MIKTREQNIITKVCRRRKGFNFKTLENVMILAVEITREKKNQFLNIPMESTVEYSEATAEMIDSEVREIIGNQYTEKRWRF
jgi:hypothetical protein